MKKVLIIEPNKFHFENLPGFSKYFLDLGYQVDIFQFSVESYGDVFCLYPESLMDRVNIHFWNGYDFEPMLKNALTQNQYEAVLLNTLQSYYSISEDFVVNIVEKYASPKTKLLVMLHKKNDNLAKKLSERWKKNIICGNFRDIGMLCPVYFGAFKNKATLNKRIKVLTIGASTRRAEIENVINKTFSRKCPEFIFISAKDHFLRKLMKPIRYSICNTLKIHPFCEEHYKGESWKLILHSKQLGNVKFDEMFSNVIQSDFLYMDVETPITTFDYKNQTSGTLILALVFNKPPITTNNVAKHYGLDESNSILFEPGHLDTAIEKMVTMSDEEYRKMCENLEHLRIEYYNQSLNNLRKIAHESDF